MYSPYHAALNALNLQVCILDQEGTIVFVNEAWLQFGRENGADPTQTGEGVNYLATCVNQQDCWTNLKSLLSGRLSSFEFEYPCHSPKGQRWFLAQFTRLPEETPGKFHAFITHQNITAHKEAELKQQQVEKEIRFIVSHARCLLWSGIVEERDQDNLRWKVHFQDEEAANWETERCGQERATPRSFATA